MNSIDPLSSSLYFSGYDTIWEAIPINPSIEVILLSKLSTFPLILFNGKNAGNCRKQIPKKRVHGNWRNGLRSSR